MFLGARWWRDGDNDNVKRGGPHSRRLGGWMAGSKLNGFPNPARYQRLPMLVPSWTALAECNATTSSPMPCEYGTTKRKELPSGALLLHIDATPFSGSKAMETAALPASAGSHHRLPRRPRPQRATTRAAQGGPRRRRHQPQSGRTDDRSGLATTRGRRRLCSGQRTRRNWTRTLT